MNETNNLYIKTNKNKMTKNILRVLFLTLTMLTFSAANAQQTNYAGSSKFTDNWYIGLNGGANTNLHTWNAPQGGHFGIEAGRNVTPIWGIRVQVSAGVNDLSNWQGHASHIHNGTVIDNLQAHVLGTFNLTNAVCGYTGVPRVFELGVFAGVGYGHGFDTDGNVQSSYVLFKNALLTKAGADLAFNIGASKAWSIMLRPTVTFNTAGHGQYCASHAVFSADAAVVYHFKNSNGKHYADRAVLRDEAEIAMKDNLISSLNKENTGLKSENEALRKTLAAWAAKPTKTDTVVVGLANPYTAKVEFDKGSSKIKDESQVKALAEQINAAGKKVNILGYASIEGEESYNNKLSEQRANIVKDALIKYGVNKCLLGKATGLGTTTKFGDNLEQNRVVAVAR